MEKTPCLTRLLNETLEVPPVTSQERWRHSKWRMFRIWKSFFKVKMDFWEKTNGTFGVLDIFTKHLCEKKMNVLWVYMPFNFCHEKWLFKTNDYNNMPCLLQTIVNKHYWKVSRSFHSFTHKRDTFQGGIVVSLLQPFKVWPSINNG